MDQPVDELDWLKPRARQQAQRPVRPRPQPSARHACPPPARDAAPPPAPRELRVGRQTWRADRSPSGPADAESSLCCRRGGADLRARRGPKLPKGRLACQQLVARRKGRRSPLPPPPVAGFVFQHPSGLPVRRKPARSVVRPAVAQERSEERRVGKGCRAWWAAECLKEK